MRHKQSGFPWIFLFFVFQTQTNVLDARPLEPEDVASLLPATLHTTNETVAAIVQDPVVKSAVQNAVGNGSLSGLVVKKNVLIIPANAPDQVLSHTEQILVAPMSHLEDIRKNITEAGQAENEEQEVDESSSIYSHELTAESDEKDNVERSESVWSSPPKVIITGDHQDDSNKRKILIDNTINEVKPDVSLPEDTITEKLKLPDYIEERIPVTIPVVAVLDPSKEVHQKIESSIVALLPNGPSDDTKTQLSFLEKNRQEIQNNVQEYVESGSMTVDPENWRITFTQPEVKSEFVSQKPTTDNAIPRDLLLTRSLFPLENASPVLWSSVEDIQDPRELEDMDVAEDIIFRPLFRFRQEARQRSNYREEYNRRNYNSYRRPYYRYRPRNYDYGDY